MGTMRQVGWGTYTIGYFFRAWTMILTAIQIVTCRKAGSSRYNKYMDNQEKLNSLVNAGKPNFVSITVWVFYGFSLTIAVGAQTLEILDGPLEVNKKCYRKLDEGLKVVGSEFVVSKNISIYNSISHRIHVCYIW